MSIAKSMECIKTWADCIVASLQHAYCLLYLTMLCILVKSLQYQYSVRYYVSECPSQSVFPFFLSPSSFSVKHTGCCFGRSTDKCSLSWWGLKSHGCVFLSCSAMLFTTLMSDTFFFFQSGNTFHFTCRTVQMDGRGHACVPMPSAHYLHGPSTHPTNAHTLKGSRYLLLALWGLSHTRHTHT